MNGFTATQELKVLVDLALISAGESDMETDRISSLHTSCLGFAPLIFDLRESEEQKVNFDDLVKACGPVWKAVETDHSLPQKLVRSEMHFVLLRYLFFYELYSMRSSFIAYGTTLRKLVKISEYR